MILSVVGVFAVCTLIDMLRRFIIENTLSALYDRIEDKIKNRRTENPE